MRVAQQAVSWGVVLVIGLACMSRASAPAPVRPGIDVLLSDSIHLVRDVRVAMLTNQSGVDARGVDDITRLVAAGVRLTAIFSPEHGFRGVLDQENIGHGVDSATGLTVFSLYGTVRAPTAAMLDGVDVLLVDLQDIGGRPYTYVSTALDVLAAAARHGVRTVVLDRPNPIGGALVQGPVLDTAFASFNGRLPVALRHGMTLGELVWMGAVRLGLDAHLTVVPAAGWTRGAWYDATGLPWIRPSPSMPDLESATHYPGLVLFEPTGVSVGRGTAVAFQVIAAPWLDARGLVAHVGALPGVALRDTVIRPVAPPDAKYDGQALPAVRLMVTDRGAYDPVATAVHLLAGLRARHAEFAITNPGRFDRLAGTDALRRALAAGTPPAEIVRAWAPALERFRSARTPYLLY